MYNVEIYGAKLGTIQNALPQPTVNKQFQKISIPVTPLKIMVIPIYENDVLFSNDTGKLGKINSECSYQESNLRPSDY